MNNISEQLILNRYTDHVVTHSRQLGRAQNHMMDIRKLGLAQITADISAQIGQPKLPYIQKKPVLFTREWLNEFALGDITRCLGPEFNIYKGRRSPRIPNGDLLLVSRIDQIDGKRSEFESPSSITAEFDVPVTPWFLDKSLSHEIPVSMLMEIALQPCGVLSAWLQTQLRYPEIDFFFRNLDGQITLLKEMDVRGKTITTKARLEKTVFSGSTIIQHFQFVLSCEGSDFLEGQTTFGYFSEQTMAAQVGLDGGISTSPWGREPENLEKMIFVDDLSGSYGNALPARKLRLIDRIGFVRNTEDALRGYILAERKNYPGDWYYANHFLGDPVMPGSLGVEAIIQAFKTEIMILSGSNSDIKFADGYELKWKYRGQVLPANAKVQVDVQITEITKRDNETIYIGHANLWADDLRIYEIQNLALIQ